MRYTLKRCWHVAAEIIVVVAILVTALRFALPHLNDYRHNLEDEIARSTGQPVTIGHFGASWHGMGPLLTLSQVRVYDKGRGADLLRSEEVKVSMNLWQSLLNGALVFDRIEISGAKLTLARRLDGRIGLEGLADNGSAAGDATGGDTFIRWLFEQGTISVRQSDIRWINQARPDHPQLVRHVNLELYNAGTRHLIDGDVRLSSEAFPDIRFSLDLVGDLTSPNWSGRGYTEALGVNLAPWLGGHDLSGFELLSGKVGMRLWSHWRSGRLQDTYGRLVAADLRVRNATGEQGDVAPELEWKRLAGSIQWRRQDTGWGLSLPDLQIDDAPTRAELTVISGKDGETAEYDIRADKLAVKGLVDVVRLSGAVPSSMEPSLKRAAFDGRLDNVHLVYRPGDAPKFSIEGEFDDIHAKGSDNLPGFEHLSGRLVADDEAGTLRLELKDTEVATAWFRTPLPVTQLSARLDWRRDAQGTALAVTNLRMTSPDLSAHGGMGAILPTDGSPDLNIKLDAKAPGGGTRVSRYLPAKIMNKDAVAWLDQAFTKGDVPRASFVLEGPLDRFPFEHGEGRFGIKADVRGVALDFAPGWPRINDIDGNLEFTADALLIKADSGESHGLAVHDVTAKISDLYGDLPVLKLSGKASGSVQQGLEFIEHSPVNEVLGDFATGSHGAGGSELDLALDIPLTHVLDTHVEGRLRFRDGTLDLAKAGFAIEGINGLLGFTESDVRARGIRARLMGVDSRIDISRQSVAKDRRVTRFQATGNIDDKQAGAILGGIPGGLIAGRTDWRATLDLSDISDPKAEDPLLRISSNLKGVTVTVPYPIAKEAAAASAFSLEMRLPQRVGRPVAVKYGQSLSGLLDLDGDMKVQRASIHWGKGRPRLVKEPGVRLTGHLDQLNLGPWLKLADSVSGKAKGDAGSQLTSVDASVDDLALAGHHFPKASVSGKLLKSDWHFDVKGPNLAGQIEFPLPLKARPLKATLDHLVLPAERQGQGAGEPVSAHEIPALEVTSKSLIFADMQLGGMTLSAVPNPDGLEIRKLLLERPESRTEIQGVWTEKDGKNASEFSSHFTTKDLGGTLQGLGFPGLISQGLGESTATFHWPGRPADFAWSTLGGHISVLFQDGRMLEIEPGAGRIIGLFSLQTLPRRLFMDFSDVLRRGYAFDRIEGDLDLTNGVARTQNLYLDGPSARIEIKGATDLAAKQYDQDVIVSPHVGSGLPVAGALAGGLGVGAAVLIFERIFQHDLAKITQVRYHVTGPWSSPTTVTVREQPQKK
ncbi:MAG: TIGR02099 family protein [Gammaproteobacteria bacterium]|nr:TIGR02099 family protein [Gammaproteobacteria bacterium]